MEDYPSGTAVCLPYPPGWYVEVHPPSSHPGGELSTFTLTSQSPKAGIINVYPQLGNPHTEGGTPLCADGPTHGGRHTSLRRRSYPPWENGTPLCADGPTHRGRMVPVCADGPTHHGRKGGCLRRGFSHSLGEREAVCAEVSLSPLGYTQGV